MADQVGIGILKALERQHPFRIAVRNQLAVAGVERHRELLGNAFLERAWHEIVGHGVVAMDRRVDDEHIVEGPAVLRGFHYRSPFCATARTPTHAPQSRGFTPIPPPPDCAGWPGLRLPPRP